MGEVTLMLQSEDLLSIYIFVIYLLYVYIKVYSEGGVPLTRSQLTDSIKQIVHMAEVGSV